MSMYRFRTLAGSPRASISVPVATLGKSFSFSPGSGTRAEASDAEIAALRSAISARTVCEDVRGMPSVLEHRPDGAPLAQFLSIERE